jgi:hypothetical protein
MAVGHVTWDNALLLQQNTDRLLRDLHKKMRRYEARYEIASSRLESEMAAGRLRETAEICDWLIALRTYRLLQDEQAARTE